MSLLLKPNPSSSVPIYVQLKEQIRHAVEIEALLPGEPLPPIRTLAEQLVVNANTIARVYRELEQEGLLELKHGVGAFVSEFAPVLQHPSVSRNLGAARDAVSNLVRRLRRDGVSTATIRRLIEAELGKESAEVVEHRATRAVPDSRARVRRSP